MNPVCSRLDRIQFTKHANEVSHPIIRPAEPGEDWTWWCIENVGFAIA
jgi:hypothetical protein